MTIFAEMPKIEIAVAFLLLLAVEIFVQKLLTEMFTGLKGNPQSLSGYIWICK